MSRFRLLLCICVLMVGGLLVGCMKGEQTMDDVNVPEEMPESEDNENSENNAEDKEENEKVMETEEKVPRELYLIDENGLVVPQTLDLPKTKSAAMQVMEYLVKDGPVTEMLPSGFKAVLPAGTEILGVNTEEKGTMTIDVSKEFSEYEPEDELQIIQAMTHTMTQFENVDRIKLWINGENQTEMPVDQTPLSEGYSKKKGINLDVMAKPDLKNNKAVTINYPKQYDNGLQYVPVTQYIDKDKNPHESMVQALLDGPSYDIVVKNVFNDKTQLTKEPSLEDGELQLEFNDAILKDKEKQVISDNVMETLVRTMTGQADVDSIKVSVEGHSKVIGESGRTYDQSMTVQEFDSKEKM